MDGLHQLYFATTFSSPLIISSFRPNMHNINKKCFEIRELNSLSLCCEGFRNLHYMLFVWNMSNAQKAQTTAGFMKTVPSVYTLLMNTIFLSYSTHVAERTVFWKHTVLLQTWKQASVLEMITLPEEGHIHVT